MKVSFVSLVAVAALAACSSPPQHVAAPPPPPKPAASPSPRIPWHIDIKLKLPPKDAAGRYITANSNLGPLETLFHFRSALNVAALGCVTPASTAQRDGYNAFLKRFKSVLANANKAIDAKYRRDFGPEGLRIRDAKLTSLYNQFSYPAVKPAFCSTTARQLAVAGTLQPGALEAYAQSALTEIEQLFQNYYAEVERYQLAGRTAAGAATN